MASLYFEVKRKFLQRREVRRCCAGTRRTCVSVPARCGYVDVAMRWGSEGCLVCRFVPGHDAAQRRARMRRRSLQARPTASTYLSVKRKRSALIDTSPSRLVYPPQILPVSMGSGQKQTPSAAPWCHALPKHTTRAWPPPCAITQGPPRQTKPDGVVATSKVARQTCQEKERKGASGQC